MLTNCTLDLRHDIPDIIIAYAGAARQTHADLEEGLGDAVHIGRCTSIDGLLVHRLPQWPRLDAGGVQEDPQGFHVIVRLTIRYRRRDRVDHAGRAANGALNPPQDVIARCEYYNDISDAMDLYENIWMEIRMAR